ncbi:MAG: hypothetical protein L0Z62_02990 [Gemmataceae bacterium]|nr:hypothetical protein [Gemmataceae bacterium]
MTEKELGKALLDLDMTAPAAAPDPRQLTRNILGRDRRRVRLLTCLSLFFWLLAVAAVGLLVWFYFMYLAPRLNAYVAGRADFERDAAIWLDVGNMSVLVILGCVVALFLAALCTVRLILVSRRATLRQINANLAEISEQLKLLRPSSARESPGVIGSP